MNYWCKCDYRLNNSAAVNKVQWLAYSEKEWEDIKKLKNIDPCYVPFPNFDVWRCPKCERFYAFKNNHVVKYYVLHDIGELGENGRFVGYDCKCGNKLDTPSAKARWIVYSDPEWIAWLESVEDIIDFVNIQPPSIDVWSCSKCERVYVFKENKLIKYYVSHDLQEL